MDGVGGGGGLEHVRQDRMARHRALLNERDEINHDFGGVINDDWINQQQQAFHRGERGVFEPLNRFDHFFMGIGDGHRQPPGQSLFSVESLFVAQLPKNIDSTSSSDSLLPPSSEPSPLDALLEVLRNKPFSMGHGLKVSRMKMCSSCRRAKYCSKLCQVYDWRSGKHKMECQFL